MQPVSKRQIVRFCLFCLALFLVTWALYRLYSPLLIPFGISLLLSYLLAPFVAFWVRRRVPRALVVFILVVTSIALGTVAFVSFIPGIYREVLALVRTMPGVLNNAIQTWLPTLNDMILGMEFISQEQINIIANEILEFVRLSDKLHDAMLTILRTAPQVLGTMLNYVLIPIFTFFLLNDYEVNKSRFFSLIPRDTVAPFKELLRRIGFTLRGVIKGQLTVAGIMGVLYIVGFSVIGLPSAYVIGAVTGICRIIPYLELVVGLTLGLVAVLSDFQSWGQLIGLFLVFLIGQTVDGMVITPKIVGKHSGLHPFVVIISVISFANLFGFWGVLLAVPVIAVLKVIVTSALPFYKASPAYDPRNQFLDK